MSRDVLVSVVVVRASYLELCYWTSPLYYKENTYFLPHPEPNFGNQMCSWVGLAYGIVNANAPKEENSEY
jgi:hypothetical protein